MEHKSIPEQVYAIAEKYFDDYRENNGEISPRLCPFCKGGSNEDQHSFFINVETGLWYCHRGHHERDSGCSNRGGLRELAEFYGEHAYNSGNRIASINTFKKKIYARPDPSEILPLTDEIIQYFAKRKISEDTLKAFKIGSDKEGNIVFPFYRDGQLIMNKYRKPKKFDKKTDKRKEWCNSDPEPILFNMDSVSFNKPLYCTEGQCDAMALYEAGISNVVSVPMGSNNTEWITICWDWLDNFPQIILFGDSDGPGIDMINDVKQRIGEDRCMLPPEYPELIINGKDYGRVCKDANEILLAYGPEKLKETALNCEPAPVRGILNLADVPLDDPSSLPRLMFRIPELDKMTGGFGEGSFLVASGMRGAGKSTLSGSLALNAIEQGEKVCAYSGELSARNYLNWIMLQATERKYLQVKPDTRTGRLYASIPYEIQKRIRKFIDGSFFLFDNKYIDEKETEEDALFRVFNACARRYGCKLFIADNMMTLAAGADEELKTQTRIVTRLKRFAVKYKAHVILVSHQRKKRPGEVFSNDSVSGTANITNLADIVINSEKPSIRVTKNREFGDLGYIECCYDPANRRIFQADTGDKIVYGWDHSGLESLPLNQVDKYPEFNIKVQEHDSPVMTIPF